MTLLNHIPIGEAQQRIEEVPTAALRLPSQGERLLLNQSVIDGTCLCFMMTTSTTARIHTE